jgi:valyl-tRNA synthetase
MSRAVRESFVRLFEKGLVYRGARLVNWDCVLETAVSDDEIEMVERKDKLYFIQYAIEGQPGRHITVATTRPETMFGDTGIAVNGEDERYRDLVGKGADAVHRPRDPDPRRRDRRGEVRHGRGQDHAGPRPGGLRARRALQAADHHDPLQGRQARRRVRTVHRHDAREGAHASCSSSSRHSARSRSPGPGAQRADLRPLEERDRAARQRAVVREDEAAGRARDRGREVGQAALPPERWQKVYLQWLENVHDWCISRQLWWGHRIPVWYDEDGVPVASRTDLAPGSPHPKTGKPIVRQDEDVLDTWASSWLWPFATLGWPDRRPTSSASIRRNSSRRRATSSTCGSRAW